MSVSCLVSSWLCLTYMKYMRASYPDTPLSKFKSVDTYVRVHGGVETLEDDEDDE